MPGFQLQRVFSIISYSCKKWEKTPKRDLQLNHWILKFPFPAFLGENWENPDLDFLYYRKKSSLWNARSLTAASFL